MKTTLTLLTGFLVTLLINPLQAADASPSAALLAADDERLMRDQLRTRLVEVWPGLQIVAEARNGLEAVELVAQENLEML